MATKAVKKEFAPWQFNYRDVQDTDIPVGAVGFIYVITLPYGKYPHSQYVGKKLLTVKKSRLAPKAQQLTIAGKLRKVPVKIRGLDTTSWKNYTGSCKPLNELIKTIDPTEVRREIIEWCFSKRELSYKEDYYLHVYKVLENPDSWNTNVAGRHFRGLLFPDIKTVKEEIKPKRVKKAKV